MKKCIAMLLTLALLVTLYGGAFADTLQLPGSLTAIEAESFSDNPALDEVSVAWGTETIESRAFASSGVKKIYIPATVTAIADDAFAGTSVTICSAADAYARQYADAHGLAWEDSGNHDRKSAVSQLVDYSAQPRGAECEPLAMLDKLPTDGIEDPQELARVEQYNAAVDDLNADIASLNQHEAEIGDAIKSYTAQLPKVSVTEKSNQVRMTMEGMALVMDRVVMDAMEQGVEIVSAEGNDDGVIALKAGNGATYYIYQEGNTCYYTSTAPGALAHANGVLAESNDWAEEFSNAVDNVENIASNLDMVFRDGLSGIAAEIAEVEFNLNYLKSQPAITDMETDIFRIELKADLNNELNRLKAKQARWTWCKRLWTGLDVFANMVVIRQIIVNWQELNQIDDHRHPTDHDTSPAALDLIAKMNREIGKLRILFAVDGLASVVAIASNIGMLAALIPTGGAAFVTERAFAVVRTLIGIVLNIMEDSKLDFIREAHAKLHTYVYGWVRDADTGEPLEGAEVTDGINTAITNPLGYYELYLMPEPATLVFTKAGYAKETAQATPELGGGMQAPDVSLEGVEGIVFGWVQNAANGASIQGATVSSGEASVVTNAEGYYEIGMSGSGSLYFSAPGFCGEYANIRSFEEDRMELNMDLNSPRPSNYMSEDVKKGIVEGHVYDAVTGAPLSGVMIYSGDIGTFTDASGYYELYILLRRSSITFQMTGYDDFRTVVYPSGAWNRSTLNVRLKP